MAPTLTDHQVSATQVPVGVIVVSAGAGTGKTTVLSETVAKKMVADGGVDIRDLVVITFTKKAAAEMAERIEQRLLELAQAATDETERKRLIESAGHVADAAIETLDAFAYRLIRDFPNESEVDPYFDILSPERNYEIGIDTARLCLEQWLDNPPHEHWQNVLQLANVNDWPETLFRLNEHVLTRALPSESLHPLLLAGKGLQDLEEARQRIKSANLDAINQCNEIRKVLVPGMDLLQGMLAEVTEDRTKKGDLSKAAEYAKDILPKVPVVQKWLESEMLDWDSDIPEMVSKWTLGRGRLKSGSPSNARTAIKEIVSHLTGKEEANIEKHETLKALSLDLAISVFKEPLALAMAEFHREFVEARRQENALSFADCEIEAIRLLVDHPEIRERCNEKYRYVVVDEYQDINPLQQELIFRVATPSKSDPDFPANLYVVGDERQSIYGFRDADFTLLKELRQKMERRKGDGEGSRILHENFRAREALLNFVNHVFRKVWRHPGKLDPLHTDLKAAFPPYIDESSGDETRIELNLVVAPDADSGRRREAVAVAKRLHEIITGGLYEIIDKNPDGEFIKRPLGWGDCAVLMRRTKPFGLYEDAFAALDIPFVTESGGGFWDTHEIADIIALLYCLSPSPGNLDKAILLRSPWVGISDDSLLAIARHLSKGNWYEKPEDVDFASDSDADRIAEFTDWFKRAQKIAGRVPIHRLLDYALVESGYIDRVLAMPSGDKARANMEKLLAIMRDESGLHEPYTAAKRIEWLRSGQSLQSQATEISDTRGAVTLATVHAAKGREWPLVILADLAAIPKNPTLTDIAWSPESGITFKCARSRTGDSEAPAGFHKLTARQKEKEEAESRRVMYVALTRPREYLILSSWIKEKKSKDKDEWSLVSRSWLYDLEDAFEENRGGTLLGNPSDAVEQEQILTLMTADPVEPEEDKDRFQFSKKDNPVKVRRRFSFETPNLPNPPAREDAEHQAIEPYLEKLRSIKPLPSATSSRYLTTVTEIAAFEKCPRLYAYRAIWRVPSIGKSNLPHSPTRQYESDTDEAGEPEEATTESLELPASEWGTIAHSLMERIPLDIDPAQIKALATAILEENGIGDKTRIDRLAAMISSTLDLDIFEKIRTCTDINREFRLLGQPDGIEETILGTIDLMADCPDGMIIIDYKSGRIDQSIANERASHYELQMTLYALLTASYMGIQPADINAKIVFLDPATEVSMNTSGTAVDRALEAVKRLSLASKTNDFTPTPSPETCKWCDYRDICRDCWCEQS